MVQLSPAPATISVLVEQPVGAAVNSLLPKTCVGATVSNSAFVGDVGALVGALVGGAQMQHAALSLELLATSHVLVAHGVPALAALYFQFD